MTSREFFIETIKDELPRFERVLNALIGTDLDYKPHKNSRSALEIVKSMISEVATFTLLLGSGKIDIADFKHPATEDIKELVQKFTKHVNEVLEKSVSMTEEDWHSKAAMYFDGKADWETTKNGMIWGFLLDLIHHRGQLSSYIRPMGGKVPSIYGPSGDSK